MKPKFQKITVIIVFVLVILFGVAQFFARIPISNIDQSTNTHTVPSELPPTQVITYAAPTPASSTPIVEGSCWTSSIAAPYRTDAWRCAVGNGIEDPCFKIGDSTSTLLCGIDPVDPASTSTFVLSLTKPLPAAENHSLPEAPKNWAWLVRLQDGTLCSPFTGTLPFAANGEVAEYGCAPQYQGDDRMIFGNLNASTSPWMAEVGTLSASTSTFPPPIIASSSVPVAEVWQ